MPPFEIGDRWTYREQNVGDRKDPFISVSQAFKSETSSGWIYFDSKNPDATRKKGVHRFDYKRGDVKESFAYDVAKPDFIGNRFSNFQPFDDIFQLPLTIGKKYNVKWEWSNGQGFDEYKIEVEAFEKVKIEAGEFEAYRVNMAGFWNQTLNPNGQAGSGRLGRTYWYAPAVKRVVKSETFSRTFRGGLNGQYVTELIKWEPKAALDAALTPVAAKPAATAPAPAVAASQ